MKNLKVFTLILSLLGLSVLSGCATVAVGGAGAAATSINDRRTTGAQIEDQSIELKAFQALNADEELKEQANVSVTSYNTVVLLTGETPTDAMRQRAVEIVKNVDKVTHIYNELTIAAPSSMTSRGSDSIITSKLKTKMVADADVNGLALKVVTEKGVVYLMGLVSRNEAEVATEIARNTGGVQKVVKLFQYTD